jgi:hypothetical protein
LRRELLGKLRYHTLTAQEVSANFERAMVAVLYLGRDSTDLCFVLGVLRTGRTAALFEYEGQPGNQIPLCCVSPGGGVVRARSPQDSLLDEVVCPGQVLAPALRTATAVRV